MTLLITFVNIKPHMILVRLVTVIYLCVSITSLLLAQKSVKEYRDLFFSNEYTAYELYTMIEADYNAFSSGDVDNQYDYAKLMASASYNAVKSDKIEYWNNKVDSLSKYIDDIPYDKSYMFHLIAAHNHKKEHSKSIELLKEMEDRAMASGDTVWMIDYCTSRANAHANFDDMAVALKYLLQAEKLNDSFDGLHQKGLIARSKAIVSWEKRDFEKTLEYYIEAASVFEKTNSYRNLSSIYSNLINIAGKQDRLDLIKIYMDKLSTIQKKIGCTPCYFTNELNKIFHHIEIGEYNEAITLAKNTISYADSMDRDASHAVYLMGVAHRGLDQYGKASSLISRAFDMAKEIKHNGKCSFYSHALYQTYYWKENYAEALDWYITHSSYQDSVYNEKKAKEIAVYESKLEALEQKRKVEELEAKVQLDKQKKRVLWLAIILGSLLGLMALYIQRQRARNEKLRQEALLHTTQLEKEKLEQQLEFKQKELTSQILNMTQKNNLLQQLKNEITDLKNESNNHAVSRLLRNINRSVENTDEWDKFLSTFKTIHSSFLKKLNELAENLTSNEIRLASLMKMNLSSKEIATMLNISDDGVKKARYRLRKKLHLASEISIQDYLVKL